MGSMNRFSTEDVTGSEQCEDVKLHSVISSTNSLLMNSISWCVNSGQMYETVVRCMRQFAFYSDQRRHASCFTYRFRYKLMFERKFVNIFIPIPFNICFWCSKNRLIEMVLLSTHNISFV